MTTSDTGRRVDRFAADWLALREPADAAARAAGLLGPLLAALPAGALTILDLGCGMGSQARWLAPLLPGPQHWILHDHDRDLLARAVAALPATSADGYPVTAEAREGDLAAADASGASLVTASALLDLLTAAQLDRLADACAGLPALFTLSVSGRVEFDRPDPLDAVLAAAFNDHQRREGRLGPDAADAAAARFGPGVRLAPSPWRLGPGALMEQWLRGWVGAAVEQRPELAGPARAYLHERTVARGLTAVVHHTDLLVVPGSSGGTET